MLREQKTDSIIYKIFSTLSIVCAVAIFPLWYVGFSKIEIAGYNIIFLLFALCLLFCGIGELLVSFRLMLRIPEKKKMMAYFLTILSFLGTFSMFWISAAGTVSYSVICCSALFGMFAFLDLLKQYNVLSTRKLPQYNYQGGDHHV